MSRQALSGLRILDLTQVAAGPYSTFTLGFLGAEIIKVESHKRGDSTRGHVVPPPHQFFTYPDGKPGPRPWDQRADYVQRNRNKLGVTLDLTMPEGKAVFLRLVERCDALMENFRAAVMERWGLDFATLSKVNPRLVYLKMSSQGNTGPERNYGSLGYTMENIAGLTSMTGYEGERPLMTNETYPDPVAGTLGIGGLLLGFRYLRQTGKGCFIDMSQREVTTGLLGDAVMDYTMNGRIAGTMGNRHRAAAPHGVYPCAGDDEWVAIAVENDAQWAGLCRALGDPAWAHDPRFADAAARWRLQADIDRPLGEWTRRLTKHDAMERLQAAGVPAGAMLKGKEVIHDPHLRERDFWDWNYTPAVGRAYAYVGIAWHYSKTPRRAGFPAPALGEHNHQVFGGLLGMTEDEIAELERKGVIGTEPEWKTTPV